MRFAKLKTIVSHTFFRDSGIHIASKQRFFIKNEYLNCAFKFFVNSCVAFETLCGLNRVYIYALKTIAYEDFILLLKMALYYLFINI